MEMVKIMKMKMLMMMMKIVGDDDYLVMKIIQS